MAKVKENKPWYTRWWAIVLFIFVGLIILGSIFGSNSPEPSAVCNTPYILVGTSCCLDANSNKICDSDETIAPINNSNNIVEKVCTQDWQCSSWSECSTSGKQTRTCTLVTNDCNEAPKDKPIELQSCTPSIVALPADTNTGVTMGEKNALSKAKSYLDYMAFSYNGLVKQLEFEGFTHSEAVYGVANCGADWNEQAALKAQAYLDYMAFSREGLINQLEFEGFTTAQAEYGVQAVGY